MVVLLFEVCLTVLMALMVFTAKNEAGKKMNIFYRGKTHVAVKITEKKTVFWWEWGGEVFFFFFFKWPALWGHVPLAQPDLRADSGTDELRWRECSFHGWVKKRWRASVLTLPPFYLSFSLGDLHQGGISGMEESHRSLRVWKEKRKL